MQRSGQDQGAGAPAPREEKVELVSQGQRLVGTLCRPAGETPAPSVLLLHGFTGSRDEMAIPGAPPPGEGVFARTARRLAARGYASLRIDFRGSGESCDDLGFADTTLDRQAQDAGAALAYLRRAPVFDGAPPAVIGWSLGGLIAARLAAAEPDLAAVALWQAVGHPLVTFGEILGAEALARGLASPPEAQVPIRLASGARIALKGAFFASLAAADPLACIAAYPGPLLVTQGLQDSIVPPRSAAAFLAAHKGLSQRWTRAMDHVFNLFETPETLESMITETIDFLDRSRRSAALTDRR